MSSKKQIDVSKFFQFSKQIFIILKIGHFSIDVEGLSEDLECPAEKNMATEKVQILKFYLLMIL